MEQNRKREVESILRWAIKNGQIPGDVPSVNRAAPDWLCKILLKSHYSTCCSECIEQKSHRRCPVLEIGLRAGHNHQELHRAANQVACEVYGVDNLTMSKADIKEIIRKVREVGGRPRILLMDSALAGKLWEIPLFLLYIDGCHDYDVAKSDYQLFSKHVVSGGLIAIHDLIIPGVSRVVLESLNDFSDVFIRQNECQENRGMFYGIKR